MFCILSLSVNVNSICLLICTGPVVYVMEVVNRIIYKVCPFVAGGVFIGSVYWTAVTYGAVTVMQVCQFMNTCM